MATMTDGFGNIALLPPGGTPPGQTAGGVPYTREGPYLPTDPVNGWPSPSLEPSRWINTATGTMYNWYTASGASGPAWH